MNTHLIKPAFLFCFVVAFILIHPTFATSGEAPMVKVTKGKYKSGPDKKEVNIQEFQIDKFEVTYDAFVKFQKEMEIPAGKGNHPVTEVSYFDAEEYCKSLGKRLPSANEWEKAARGTDARDFPWGPDFDTDKANTLDSDLGGTTPVGNYKKGQSPYGAHDMAGNVWEWVNAWESDNKQYRIVMGGSFFDDSIKSKVFTRLSSIPDDTHTYIGFRCAK